MSDSIDDLRRRLQQFAQERAWQQFHSPKNLACALIVEAGELLEHFQWMTEEHSRLLDAAQTEAVAGELADVLLYLVQLSDAAGIDLLAAANAKLELNATRYPVDRAHGSSRKHDQL